MHYGVFQRWTPSFLWFITMALREGKQPLQTWAIILSHTLGSVTPSGQYKYRTIPFFSFLSTAKQGGEYIW